MLDFAFDKLLVVGVKLHFWLMVEENKESAGGGDEDEAVRVS
jgi:hypothetical protein